MKLEVKIPYICNESLAYAYNKAVEESQADWVLLLDHDVFLATNINWYNILIEGINKVPENTGLITCVTSGREGWPQASDINVGNHNILEHQKVAHTLYTKHGNKIKEVRFKKIAGYFIVVNKKVHEKIKFKKIHANGLEKTDWDYCEKLLNNNYKIYVMPGLYIYHMQYRRRIK